MENYLKKFGLVSDKTIINKPFKKTQNVKVFSGCELTYFIDYLRNLNIKFDHTFENGIGMDAYSLIYQEDKMNEFMGDNVDCIIISQVQFIKTILIKYTENVLNVNIENDAKKEIYTRLDVTIKFFQKFNVPIFILSYPKIDIHLNGINADSYKDTIYSFLLEYRSEVYKKIKEYPNLYFIDVDRILEYEKITPEILRYEVYGGHLERQGAVIVANEFIRKIRNIDKHTIPIKCVVVDCDNTLWDGILREDGVKRLKLRKNFIYLLYVLSLKGILICLCSKNDEEDLDLIKNVLKQSPGFLRNIVNFKINWKPKSINIKEIAQELNISTDSIIFIDDNPMERAEVSGVLPEVETFADDEWIDVIKHPRFNSKPVTKSASQRTKMYITEGVRKKELKENYEDDFEKFLYGSGLKIKFVDIDQNNIGRVHEILQRTNQLNVTLKRTNLNDLRKYLNDKNFKLKGLYLDDKFGSYGMVGTYILNKNHIQEFALSCRGMGRCVEDALLINLVNYLISEKYTDAYISITENSRNKNLVDKLIKIGFKKDITNNFCKKLTDKMNYPPWFEI